VTDELSKRRETKKPENRYCFECPCGNQTFVMRPDAKVQCSYCELIQPRLIWGQFFESELFNPPDQT